MGAGHPHVQDAFVIETAEIAENLWLTWLGGVEAHRSARPGQFFMFMPGFSDDPLLPRPMSYHRFRDRDGAFEFAVLYSIVGRGTGWLAERRPGDEVPVLGPLGNGFDVRPDSGNLLCVAGGVGVAPFAALADEAIRHGRSVLLAMGARTASMLLPAPLVPAEVEIAVATDDGTAGHRGPVSELFERHLAWCDQAFACGPTPMFHALAAIRRRSRWRKPVQALLEERMACGFGACYSCAVRPRRGGVKLVCRDGPQFDLLEMF
ncbi:MAG TPA: dihydroorotate dehydrogenase electron transfer subunit [Dehalococcoidia bacterium]|nr:dihydroorotate dehydrogenase electron transfer subunit [Dehalococcoidia bacterium]